MVFKTINAATGKPLDSYRATSGSETARILKNAEVAFAKWRRVDINDRAAILRAAATELRRTIDVSAQLMALEMGKPLAQGRAEVEKCAACCDFFAENGAGFLAPEMISGTGERAFVAFEPLGVVLAIMPWNFPFWQIFRCAVPALLAGNAVIFKPALNTAGCGRAVQRIFEAAGLPKGLFSTLLIEEKRIAKVIEADCVRAVSLTGSTRAGRAVASLAGVHLKKTVLELGGSDPYVVLADCDLELAVKTCVNSRMINGGQSCIAAKRFIVERSLRKQFENLFVELMRAKVMGDPLQPATTLGPLARKDLRDALHSQVRRSIARGAKLLLGGRIPGGPGWFYPATVLTNVRKGMAAADEETFGPVAAIISAANETEAIRVANDSSFGLGAAVFTSDHKRGERIAATELNAGNCFVNELVRSDLRMPFGGIKDSGYGRELGVFGIREFVNIKSVCVK